MPNYPDMTTNNPKPAFVRAMSQLRNQAAWTWHWLRSGEIGAIERRKAFDVSYVRHLLRRMRPKLESRNLSRELQQIDTLNTVTDELMLKVDEAELPSPLASQRIRTVIESVQVSLAHTLSSKIKHHEVARDMFADQTAANDESIAAITQLNTAFGNSTDFSCWESVELVIAALEQRVAQAHQRLADGDLNAKVNP